MDEKLPWKIDQEILKNRLRGLINIIGFYGFIVALLIGIIIAIESNPNTLLFGVGQSLIASGLFALIMLLHQYSSQRVEEDSEKKFLADIKSAVESPGNVLQGEIKLLRESIGKDLGCYRLGLNRIYIGTEKKAIRSVYSKCMSSAGKRIEILARKADEFVEDFLVMKDEILKKETHVKILIVHPKEGNFLKSMIKKWDINQAKMLIISNTRKILELKDPRVEVKWYENFPPSVTISIFDDALFITPYLVGKSHKVLTKTPL